ncbi:DCC1-like thiol-disulfide oxidoreductase family protein [Flavobacteriaceae sp. LMIT009]
MIELEKGKQLVIFDGVCNLCNASIIYIIKRDKNDIFRFAPLQSDIGQKIIKDYNIDTIKTDSILLYNLNKGLFSRSTAVLKVASRLSFPTNLYAVFLIIPAFIRNAIYDFIARNRYKWYGKKESCMIPTPELKKKFLH